MVQVGIGLVLLRNETRDRAWSADLRSDLQFSMRIYCQNGTSDYKYEPYLSTTSLTSVYECTNVAQETCFLEVCTNEANRLYPKILMQSENSQSVDARLTEMAARDE
jgi:hypothetical protein